MEAIFLKDDYFYVEDDRRSGDLGELVFNGTKSTGVLKGRVFLRIDSESRIKFIMCGEELGLFEYDDCSREYQFSKSFNLNKIAYWLNKIQNAESDFMSDYKEYLRDFLDSNEDSIDSDTCCEVRNLLCRLF
jgi:hypothetical protein